MRKLSAWMKKSVLLMASILLLSLSLPAPVFAAPGGESGKPGGWPDGEGPPDGKGPRTGGGDTRKGDIFGDPMVVVRDLGPDGDGKPLYFKWTWPQELYVDEELVIGPDDLPTGWTIPTDQTGPAACVQPISLEPLQNEQGEIEDQSLFIYQDYLDSYGPEFPVYLIPLDDECMIPEAYASTWGEQVSEVDAGRLNLARTTQPVIDAAYAEAIANISAATAISLDPAGRLLLTLAGDVLKTVDSPRENIALYQKLMQEACLTYDADVYPGLDELFVAAGLDHLLFCDRNEQGEPLPSQDDLLRAASFLAGSADKFGHVGIDEVIYINTILGINAVEPQPDDSWLITGYKDVGDFIYTRSDIHGDTAASLLQPVYINGQEYFEIQEPVYVYDQVFAKDWEYFHPIGDPLPSYPIMNFVRATDDALSIIYYIHNFEPPIVSIPKVD